jgi:hypothetical protein
MSEWISIKDRLPEFNKNVLFYGKDKVLRIGALYRHSHKFISDGDKFYVSDVPHWMPLPELPTK